MLSNLQKNYKHIVAFVEFRLFASSCILLAGLDETINSVEDRFLPTNRHEEK